MPASAAARDGMQDALATLTRVSAELSVVYGDGRRRSGVPRGSLPGLAGAHLPVFAKAPAPALDPAAGGRRPRRSSLSRSRPVPVPQRPTAPSPEPASAANSGSTIASGVSDVSTSSRSEGRRRRRDMYRTSVRVAARERASETGPAEPACFVEGTAPPPATLFDLDDYLITHDDHVWAAPALATAAESIRVEPEEAGAPEGFFESSAGGAAASARRPPPHPGRSPGGRVTFARSPSGKTRRDGSGSVTGVSAATATSNTAAAPIRALGRSFSRSRRRREKSIGEQRLPDTPAAEPAPETTALSDIKFGPRRRLPVRAATVQPSRASLSARARSPGGPGGLKTSGSAKSAFVPESDTRFVKQQSYCKTGHVPGLRRTRFLRLIGSKLVCFSRDLNRQLWAADVQHSFVKVNHSQRKVIVFCARARRPLSFYLASNDMLSSWARALARASVASFPKKYSSQKTAKELEREGVFL